ncbi:15029_t:CDS:2 [Funneliformis geosporum]|nr:15029_t:CDS:2 [Funneliformis geosporum]
MVEIYSQYVVSLLSTTGPIFLILRRISSMQSLNSEDFSSTRQVTAEDQHSDN